MIRLLNRHRKLMYIVVSIAVVFSMLFIYFSKTAFAYVTGPLEFQNYAQTGAMTHPGYNSVEGTGAAQITMNGKSVLEVQDPTSTGGYSMAGSYLYTEATTFNGTTVNPQFVNSVIRGYQWVYTLQGDEQPGIWYAASDAYALNGLKFEGTAPAFWPDGSKVSLSTVANPQFSATLSSKTIQPGGTYTLNTDVSSYGYNAGYYTNSFFSAYWVPIINGTPSITSSNYALTTNDSGNATIYGWPSPNDVVEEGDSSNLGLGYPGGFPNGFEQVPYSEPLTDNEQTVTAPSIFPKGTTGYDLVVFYGDPLERYDAQIVSVDVPPSPVVTLTADPDFSQKTGSYFTLTCTVNQVEPGEMLDISQTSNSGPATFPEGGRDASIAITQAQDNYTTSVEVYSDTAATVDYKAYLTLPGGGTDESNVVQNP